MSYLVSRRFMMSASPGGQTGRQTGHLSHMRPSRFIQLELMLLVLKRPSQKLQSAPANKHKETTGRKKGLIVILEQKLASTCSYRLIVHYTAAQSAPGWLISPDHLHPEQIQFLTTTSAGGFEKPGCREPTTTATVLKVGLGLGRALQDCEAGKKQHHLDLKVPIRKGG